MKKSWDNFFNASIFIVTFLIPLPARLKKLSQDFLEIMEKMKKTKLCKKVVTKDHEGLENGWLLEIGSVHDNFTENLPGQVYLSVCKPKMVKGFHLHKKKTNHYTCIKGNVKLVVWDGEKYNEYEMGEKNYMTVKVRPGEPAAFYNPGDEDAYIINVCFPAWFSGDNEMEDWGSDYQFK